MVSGGLLARLMSHCLQDDTEQPAQTTEEEEEEEGEDFILQSNSSNDKLAFEGLGGKKNFNLE